MYRVFHEKIAEEPSNRRNKLMSYEASRGFRFKAR